jgi:hypothetical protein
VDRCKDLGLAVRVVVSIVVLSGEKEPNKDWKKKRCRLLSLYVFRVEVVGMFDPLLQLLLCR